MRVKDVGRKERGNIKGNSKKSYITIVIDKNLMKRKLKKDEREEKERKREMKIKKFGQVHTKFRIYLLPLNLLFPERLLNFVSIMSS